MVDDLRGIDREDEVFAASVMDDLEEEVVALPYGEASYCVAHLLGALTGVGAGKGHAPLPFAWAITARHSICMARPADRVESQSSHRSTMSSKSGAAAMSRALAIGSSGRWLRLGGPM